MFSAVLNPTRFKAILFDVDGTLYRQGPSRRAPLFRLVRAHVYRPRQGVETLRALHAYRKAQERLRLQSPNGGDIAQQQVQGPDAEAQKMRAVRSSLGRCCCSGQLGCPVSESRYSAATRTRRQSPEIDVLSVFS